RSLFPEAVFWTVGPDEPVYVLDGPATDSPIVGVVMPMRMERSAVPQSVAAALDAAWMRLGIPGAAPYGTLAVDGTKTANTGGEAEVSEPPDVEMGPVPPTESGEAHASDSRGARDGALVTERGRIEVAFAERPAMEVRAQLKNAGFRWEGRS